MSKKSEKVKLSPPWDAHMQMLKSFFKGDDRIEVEIGTEKGAVEDAKTHKPLKGNWVIGTVKVSDADCCIALKQALRRKVEFGNVSLAIDIIPANEDVEKAVQKKLKAGKKLMPLAALKEVLKKNPAFSKLKMSRLGDRTICFCIFKAKTLQWYNDNLGSPWKIATCTYECQADRVFAEEIGAQFCTEPVREEEEDLTSITVCASMASGKWNVTGVAVKPVAEGKPFGKLLETVKKFLDKNIVITVGEGK